MALLERIDSQLIAALKGKESLKVSALRMLKAEILNVALKQKKATLEDGEILLVIGRLLKERQESVEAFTKGARADLAKKEQLEAEILKSYLPPALEESELRALIQETIRELKASGTLPALGQVMKALMPKVKGRADGKLVNQLVLEALK